MINIISGNEFYRRRLIVAGVRLFRFLRREDTHILVRFAGSDPLVWNTPGILQWSTMGVSMALGRKVGSNLAKKCFAKKCSLRSP